MESIKFPEMTGTYAKSQPQYKTLHLHEMAMPKQGKDIKQYTAKYGLNDFEVAQIVKTHSLFSSQVGNVLHSSSVLSYNPFFCVPVYYTKNDDGYFTCKISDGEGKEHQFHSLDASGIIDTIVNFFTDLSSPDQLYFIERSVATVGPEGLEGI